MSSNYKGSEWRKWDFHIHTPASFSWQGPNDDAAYESIITKMNASDIDAYVVTDYWTFDGYQKLISINERLPSDKKLKKNLFPGIELRYDVLTDEEPQVRVNFQLVVDNSGTIEEVNQRLNQISSRIKLSGTDKIIADQSFIELSREYSDDLLQALINKNGADCGDEDYLLAGKKSCYVDYEAMRKDIFENDEVNTCFLLIGPWDKYGGIANIDKILRSDTTKKLLTKTHFIESSVLATEKLFLCDKDYLKGKAFGDKWKRFLKQDLKACVCGSDQKNLSEFGKLPGNIATWVKADLTFEGLRQGIYEPRYRVRLGESKPVDPITKISEVKLSFPAETKRGKDKFCFAGPEYTINLSPNLTCVIGGRGTGKSTLLELINFSLNGDSGESIKDISIPDGIEIHELISVDDEDSEKALEFLSQDSIESFATDQIEFTKAIRQRIHKLAHDDGVDDLIHAMDEADTEASQQIERVREKRQAETRIAKLEKELKATKNILQSVQDPEYVRLSRDLTVKLGEHKKFAGYLNTINSMVESIGLIQKEFTLTDPEVADQYAVKIREALNNLKESKNKLGEVDSNALRQEIKSSEDKVDKARTAIRDYFTDKGLSREDLSDLSNASKRIADYEGKLEREVKALHEIDREIEAYDITKLKVSASNYRNSIIAQIIPVNKQLASLSSEVRPIALKYSFDQERARKRLLQNIISEFDLQVRTDYLDAAMPIITAEKLGTKSDFIDAVQQTNSPINLTQTKLIELFEVDANFAILEVMVSREFENELIHGTIEVTYDGKSLLDSSFGQRCTAAIVVLLYLGNNPIIIDEPEAHLDSGLIANYLVDLIKQRKQSRQIIFATHNANFVINGDSELILILTNNDSVTEIKPTTIENVDTKLDLMKLEGSKQAFTIRKDKYNLGKI